MATARIVGHGDLRETIGSSIPVVRRAIRVAKKGVKKIKKDPKKSLKKLGTYAFLTLFPGALPITATYMAAKKIWNKKKIKEAGTSAGAKKGWITRKRNKQMYFGPDMPAEKIRGFTHQKVKNERWLYRHLRDIGLVKNIRYGLGKGLPTQTGTIKHTLMSNDRTKVYTGAYLGMRQKLLSWHRILREPLPKNFENWSHKDIEKMFLSWNTKKTFDYKVARYTRPVQRLHRPKVREGIGSMAATMVGGALGTMLPNWTKSFAKKKAKYNYDGARQLTKASKYKSPKQHGPAGSTIGNPTKMARVRSHMAAGSRWSKVGKAASDIHQNHNKAGRAIGSVVGATIGRTAYKMGKKLAKSGYDYMFKPPEPEVDNEENEHESFSARVGRKNPSRRRKRRKNPYQEQEY